MNDLINSLIKEELLQQAYDRSRRDYVGVLAHNRWVEDKTKMENLVPYIDKRDKILDALSAVKSAAIE